MPAWWGKKSHKNKEVAKEEKNDGKRKPKSFDEVLGSGPGHSGRGGSSSGFSGFDSDRGHPLPQPSGIDHGGVGGGLGSGSVSVSSGSSSISSDDPNNVVDHPQFGVYRGHIDNRLGQQPRSPGPGSRATTASTSPLHPRFTSGASLDSPTRRLDDGRSEFHPLPLPPGSPTSPSLPTSRNSIMIENSHQTSRWKKGKLLGRGTFGHVYLGFNSGSGQMCAIKEVRVVADDQSSKECLKQLNQEISLLSQLSHRNIVQYYGSELGEETLSVYLEYVSGGSIHKLLQEYGPFGEPIIQNYTRQILAGLAYLHGRNTVHRDIKGANILVDPNGEVKLADFGMAKHITSHSSMLSFKGSPYWMAPEVVMNTNGYSLAVDIWSLGCTVLEMSTSKPPWGQYEGVAAIFKIGNSKDIPDIPDHLSNDAKSFIKLCLQRDPSARPTALKLLEHPFVRDQATTRVANVSVTKEAFPSAFDGSRTPTASELYPNRTNISSFDMDYTRQMATTSTSRGTLLSPRNSARSITSLPVSPCSSPLRQLGPGYKSCYLTLSPPHPNYAKIGGQAGYNLNEFSTSPIRTNLRSSFDPWYEIPQFNPQTPPNRSPRTRLL